MDGAQPPVDVVFCLYPTRFEAKLPSRHVDQHHAELRTVYRPTTIALAGHPSAIRAERLTFSFYPRGRNLHVAIALARRLAAAEIRRSFTVDCQASETFLPIYRYAQARNQFLTGHCRDSRVNMAIRLYGQPCMTSVPSFHLPDPRGIRHGGSADTLSGAMGREHEHRALPGAAAVQQPDERHQVFACQHPEGGEGARCHERGARGETREACAATHCTVL